MTEGVMHAGAASKNTSALTVALCFGVMVIEGFDIQAMGVAAPALGPELKLSREVLGQALSASNIGLVFGAILGGWLADVFGRKPVLVAATATFGLFTLMTMQSTSFEMLFAARLLTGLGFGAALPNVMAVAADVARDGKRGVTAAMMFCGMPFGGSLVALLSWLGYQHEWRGLFLIGGIIPLVLAPLLAFLMRETQKPAGAEKLSTSLVLSWLSAIPLGVAFWYGLDQLGHLPGAGSVGGIIAPWLGGVLGIMAAYLIANRDVLFGGGRAPASMILWLTFVPTLLIVYLVLNWLPTLVAAKGFEKDASLASVFFNTFSVVGALLIARISDSLGLIKVVVTSFIALIAVLFALATATGFWPIMLLSGALGFFLLGCNYALYGAAGPYYPAEMRGRGSGAAIAWGRLGSVSGPLLGGYLLQGGATPDQVVYAMAPVALVAAVGTFLLMFAGKPQG